MKFFVTLAALAAVVTPLAIAQPQGQCDSGDNIALGIIEIPTPAGIFYMDDRNYVLGNGLWTYQETNGVYDDVNGHLQRGGASPFVPDDSETCTDVGDWDPDLLIQ